MASGGCWLQGWSANPAGQSATSSVEKKIVYFVAGPSDPDAKFLWHGIRGMLRADERTTPNAITVMPSPAVDID